MGSIKIAPSVLSADMANLKGELDKIAGADYVHFDVMDGHFTGNLTFGVDILKAVKRSTNVPVDAHLMVSNPDETVDWYADAGADMITVHYEASTHLHRTLTHLQQRGVKAGVVLNPATPVCVLESIIDVVDMVLLMSVNPGFGGPELYPGHYRQTARAQGHVRAPRRVAHDRGRRRHFFQEHCRGRQGWCQRSRGRLRRI